MKKGTKNIEQKQQIADAEAIINYLTLCTSILVFTLLEDNYNTHPKNLKSKSTASEGCAPTFIEPQIPHRIRRYRLNSQEYLLHQIIMKPLIKFVRSVVLIKPLIKFVRSVVLVKPLIKFVRSVVLMKPLISL